MHGSVGDAQQQRPERAVVVANGVIADLAPLREVVERADLVVAADGGARLLLDNGLRPHVVVGDMDSIPPPMLAMWRASGGRTIDFPPQKDETDLELALTHVVERGARRVTVLGALGGRIDHAMANILLLATPMCRNVDSAIVDAGTRIKAIYDTVEFMGEPGDTLSLLPLTARVDGIVTEGLAYTLDGESLFLGPARGVSNVFLRAHVAVRITAGVLLACHTWTGERAIRW